MNVLLVVPSTDTCYERVPSMGLMNLYLIGKQLGCNMELIDLTEVSYGKGLKKILSKKYDIIGISCNFTNSAPSCMRYAKDIKEKYPDTLAISGGNHATLVPEDLLFNNYDFIIYGEGEVTFKNFLERMILNKAVEDLKGICYLKEDKIVRNKRQDLIECLDLLPVNDYSEFNLESYFKRSGLRYISLETSRGCPYNCAFCSTVRMWGHQYRHKSPKRIVQEFKIAQELNLEFIFIEDDDTALDEQNLRNFCQLLIDENVSVPWGMGIGSASIKEESTFDLLVRSGCVKVNVNIESANQRIMQLYRKPYSIEDNRRLCWNLRKRGILIHNHGIVGFYDETIRETLNTYFYLIKTSPIWHVSILEPRPGSDYWENWKGRGDISQYRLFGKANVILGKHKIIPYLIYRIFALFYFINPIRAWRSLSSKGKGVRYSYRIQYFVAYQTIKQNIMNFIRRFTRVLNKFYD